MPTKHPPALPINEAISVVKDMYSKHGGTEVAIDLMPEILGVKPSSSYVPAQIGALQKFGLVRKADKDMLELTDLAMQIIKPVGDEKDRAIISIFEKIEVLSELYQKFGKTTLPSQEQLKQSLMKNFEIGRDTVDKWYEFIVQSFKALNLVDKNALTGSSLDTLTETVNKQSIGKNRLSLPISDGKVFEYVLPSGYTAQDLDIISRFFEFLKTTTK